jgi:hypothetical protein
MARQAITLRRSRGSKADDLPAARKREVTATTTHIKIAAPWVRTATMHASTVNIVPMPSMAALPPCQRMALPCKASIRIGLRRRLRRNQLAKQGCNDMRRRPSQETLSNQGSSGDDEG